MRPGLAILAVAAACGGGGGEPLVPATPASTPAPAPTKRPPPSSVIEVGPAPEEVPPPQAGPARVVFDTGIPECDDYLALLDRLIVECATQLGTAVDAMTQARDGQAEAFRAWRKLDPTSLASARQAAAPACKQARDAMHQAATSMGCPLGGGP